MDDRCVWRKALGVYVDNVSVNNKLLNCRESSSNIVEAVVMVTYTVTKQLCIQGTSTSKWGCTYKFTLFKHNLEVMNESLEVRQAER